MENENIIKTRTLFSQSLLNMNLLSSLKETTEINKTQKELFELVNQYLNQRYFLN